MAKIAVAGATGFVGSRLIKSLASKHHVIALTRGQKRVDTIENGVGIEWRTCDLFSMLETEVALIDVDYTVYLIHSMLPAAELTQGRFEDLDLLVADNFAKAAKICGVKHIVYVGGIIPPTEKLSRHLRSREEVEKSLRATNIPLTVLRAAMILGSDSSSLAIMTKLIKRLPIMFCPKWANNRSNPVYIDDVVKSIEYVLFEPKNRTYDLGGRELLSYKELMQKACKVLKIKRVIFTFPYITRGVSSFWVSLISGAPRNLVKPLIESLRHEMLVKEEFALKIPNHEYESITQALIKSYSEKESFRKRPRAFSLPKEEFKEQLVRSVQRLTLPKGKNATDVGDLYFKWLPKKLAPFVQVKIIGNTCYFNFIFLKKSLLIIKRSERRSTDHRQLFYIKGGLLVKKTVRGRLEFRETCNGNELLTAIHDYEPALSWQIYKRTQALVHLYVMSAFNKYLKSL